MQTRDELKVMVEAEVARAVENLKKFDKSVGDAEHSTKSLGDAIDSVAKKSMILSGVIGGAGIAAVKFAGENEKLKLSLQTMLGSADEAAGVFEEWRRLGASPGLSTDEVFALGKAMVNMGRDTRYATDTIKMLGDVAAGTGSSFGSISGAFERVRAQRKLTTRDLANLQQQGVPVLKQMARDLGTSEEGVRRLAAEGKLGFAELERAFRGMASPGGQFSGMMETLSGATLEKFNSAMDDAKQALASFGELMLPLATELLDGASAVLQGINGMDEGNKRFVIGMAGVTAAAGPAILAVKGVSAAMAAVAANPYILAIGGAIATAGVVAGIINKQAHAYGDLQKEIHKTDAASKSLFATYSNGNDAKILDEKTTRELIKLYPELNKMIKANTTTVSEAAGAQREANARRAMDAQRRRIDELKIYQGELAKINQSISEMENSREYYSGEHLERYNQELAGEVTRQQTYLQKIYSIQNEINKALAPFGKKYTLADDFMDIPVTVTVNTSALEGPPPVMPEAKKRWQDWYGEITKIDPARFGSSGAKAAELYLDEFSRAIEAGKTVSAALGDKFNIAAVLRGQQDNVRTALTELLAINANDIDKPFKLISDPIEPLIDAYKRLGAEIKAADDAMLAAAAREEYARAITDLKKKIDDFGKSEGQLAYEAALLNRALPEQADELRRLAGEYRRTEILAEYRRQIDEVGKSQRELAVAAYAAAGATELQMSVFKRELSQLDELLRAEQLMETIKGVKDSLVDLGAGTTLSGIEELGKAFGKGADFGDAMKNSFAAMHLEILNAMPSLFLQAGLQLIAQGQWALGLGFVAAAGTVGLAKGFVDGRAEDARAAARANARGNVFDTEGVRAFSRGGTFTNQIVTDPTLFKFSKGTGLMGEAGPEAIVPLKRMANGDLGVRSAGGGSQVTVNVYNNSGAEVRREEREDPEGGRQIDIFIGELIGSQIARGRHDAAIESRFEGLRKRGR